MSNVLRSLEETQKKGLLALLEKTAGMTVMQILQERHLNLWAVNAKYIRCNTVQTFVYLFTVFDRMKASSIKTDSLEKHGSHRPSGMDAKR